MWDQGISTGGFSSRLLQLVQEEDWIQHVCEPTRYRIGQRPSLRHYDTALCQVIFDVADVEKLLKRINPCSAVGPDDIHPRILKEEADVLALPLFSLFTDSLLTGVLPAAWK